MLECLSGDLKGRGLEPHRLFCVVSLSKTYLSLLVQPKKTCPDLTEKLLTGM